MAKIHLVGCMDCLRLLAKPLRIKINLCLQTLEQTVQAITVVQTSVGNMQSGIEWKFDDMVTTLFAKAQETQTVHVTHNYSHGVNLSFTELHTWHWDIYERKLGWSSGAISIWNPPSRSSRCESNFIILSHRRWCCLPQSEFNTHVADTIKGGFDTLAAKVTSKIQAHTVLPSFISHLCAPNSDVCYRTQWSKWLNTSTISVPPCKIQTLSYQILNSCSNLLLIAIKIDHSQW